MTTSVALATFVDRHTLRFDVTYPHPVDEVWSAITDPAQLALWFMPVDIELVVGGRFVLTRSDSTVPHGVGVIDELITRQLLVVRFVDGEFHFGPGCTVRFALSPTADGDGCRVRFVHRLAPDVTYDHVPGAQFAGPGTFPPGTLAGWHGFTDGLARLLDGSVPPLYTDDDERVMDQRTETYRSMVEQLTDGTPA